jgi:hypothetical protein
MRDDDTHYFLMGEGWRDGGFLPEGKGDRPSRPEGCLAHFVHFSPNNMYSTAYGQLVWTSDDRSTVEVLLRTYGRNPHLAEQRRL